MSDHPLALHSASIADTHAIASVIAELSRPGDIIVLSGEMGSGKTAFAQGFGRAIGVTDRVTSPTSTLVHSYPIETGPHAGKVTFHHADLYRLERTTEVADLALRELAEFAGIVLVEWGDVVDLFGDHLVIHLDARIPAGLDEELDLAQDDHDASDDDGDVLALDGARHIEIDAIGPGWAGRWDRLLTRLGPHRC
ncbi:MAG: tRNA (adenosine(37)-N6)-threonylcarbamoyltransferase complex ATPase subunit type 1 TsaE [Ilumatobacter sp.]|uniref:tRNA (adenosine(37)-N6)-threonylcarbamoyltransferase complex ATPase subunit type 1 TsaE n=1 Tax=Ilumatobacter sp. TaxID=1967498 RepID=UPI0032995EF0